MADQPRRRVLPARGAAVVAEQEATADPSLDALAARLEALETTSRLQALELQASREATGEWEATLKVAQAARAEAEQGMQAALEALQKLREEQPVDMATTGKMLQAVAKEANERRKHKMKVFMEKLKSAPKVPLYNYGPLTELQVNGVRIVLPTGMTMVPAPFMPAWECHLEAEQDALLRDTQARGGASSLDYGKLQEYREDSRPRYDLSLIPSTVMEPPVDYVWDEEGGLVG